MGLGISHIVLKELSFWQCCPEVSVQNSSVVHIEIVVDGDWETFILWAPDFGPARVVLPLQENTWIKLDFEKTGNFRKLIKLMNSLSMYNTKMK